MTAGSREAETPAPRLLPDRSGAVRAPHAPAPEIHPAGRSRRGGALSANLAPVRIVRHSRAFSSVSEFASLLVLAISPLIVAVPIVAAGAVMIGLPTTRLLKRWNQENGFTYTAAGGGSGAVMALVLAVLLDVPDLPWAALLGASSGAVTGFSWWRLARSARVAARKER